MPQKPLLQLSQAVLVSQRFVLFSPGIENYKCVLKEKPEFSVRTQ